MTAFDDWAAGGCPARAGLERFAPLFRDVRIAFLGEMNHFVREKTAFRLAWLGFLANLGFRTVGEEIGFSDGTRIDRFLARRDAHQLERLSSWGYEGDARDDRDDRPRGILRASADVYPVAAFRHDQRRLYTGMAAIGGLRFFGFDIDALPGGGYADIHDLLAAVPDGAARRAFEARLARRPGESVAAECERLAGARRAASDLGDDAPAAAIRESIDALIASLEWIRGAFAAADYEALRPAMAAREDAMKARLEAALARGEKLVLMGHALHLARNDATVAAQGIGPGGGRVPSLGHHLTQVLGVPAAAVWMIYGTGRDAQPFPDLPNEAHYPATSLNARLARACREPTVLATAAAPLPDPVEIGGMYDMVFATRLAEQADIVHFVPVVSPIETP